MPDLEYRTTITYTGPYWDSDGEEHEGKNMRLVYVDEEHEDRSAGILGSAVYAVEEDKEDTDENAISVDLQNWMEVACEQSGGHNYVNHSWDGSPESACRICTRCGSEIDPA